MYNLTYRPTMVFTFGSLIAATDQTRETITVIQYLIGVKRLSNFLVLEDIYAICSPFHRRPMLCGRA
jgi:hypothetical protein